MARAASNAAASDTFAEAPANARGEASATECFAAFIAVDSLSREC